MVACITCTLEARNSVLDSLRWRGGWWRRMTRSECYSVEGDDWTFGSDADSSAYDNTPHHS